MIRFEQVSFRYGTDEQASPIIVGEVSFCLRPGECVGLAGNNGSGKSTIALLAKGLLLPSGGRVTVDGADTRDQTEEQKTRVGLLFQDPDHQIVGTTIREDIAFGLENIGVEPDEIERRILTEADRLGLAAHLDQPVHTLSGGTRQKAALAAVLSAGPGFIILDEPTSQLDPWAREALWQHLDEIRAQSGIGLLVISQHLSDMERANRVMVLSGGKIVADDTVTNITSAIKIGAAPSDDDPFFIFRTEGHAVSVRTPSSAARSGVPTEGGKTLHRLDCAELSIGYRGNVVRENLTGTFQAGGVNLVVGPSGSGKTTLLMTLAGFLQPIGGGIVAEGNTEWSPEGRIGLAFQNPERLFFCETVGEEVCFALRQKGVDAARAVDTGRAWLGEWGISSDIFWDRSPLQLSGGEMRRIALAACTIANPDLLLLDEPLAGLDAAGRRRVGAIIARLARERVVICVTHDPEELLADAASVLFLHGGASNWFASGAAFVEAMRTAPGRFPLHGMAAENGGGASLLGITSVPTAAVPPGRQPGVASAAAGSTWLYRLHPLVKGCGALGIILMLSIFPGSIGLTAFWLAAPLLIALFGGAPVGDALRDLRRIWFLVFLVGALNVAAGGENALATAAENILRLCGVCVIATIYVAISTQAELMAFWETCFRPLTLFGVNVREPALVMVIAVRFLPVMLEEIERIRLAQRARGARFDAGWRGTFIALLPLLVPTLTLAIRRAHVLAVAMESRGYRLTGRRTKYRIYRVSAADYAVALAMAAAAFGSAYFRYFFGS
ncbi:ATP-binding cassette domain-containing protein [Candidatus Ozemobacteraceae bacterium]|nr:ATP-binding cassette domain-containing protein [Candidatus Ozemobacteraceae bacterium]